MRFVTKIAASSIAYGLLAFALGFEALPTQAEPTREGVLAPLVVNPIATPNPVLGADDNIHLAYELLLLNLSSVALVVDKVETLNGDGSATLGTLAGEGLSQMLRLNGSSTKSTQIPPGGSGILFMDVTLTKDAAIPNLLKHQFTISVEKQTSSAPPSDHDPAIEPPQEITFISDSLEVGSPAVTVAPPLKGKRWVVGGGCCASVTYHRGATLPINGGIRVTERFAIDFVQLDDKNRIASGPVPELSSYSFFGDEIYSVAEGTVVRVENNLPEQVPGKLPEGATIQMAAGNHVVVDIGEGRYAFYAHMQPGSVRVKVGDKVTTGQVLGLLGNSGNTDTPHLHFHIMDSPSPLDGNGLPYVFSSFTGEGRVTEEKPLFSGGTADIDAQALAGPHKDQLPLNLEVVSFP